MKKNIFKFIILIINSTMLLFLSALAQEPLKVGTTPTGTPFSFVGEDGEATGIMVDLITAISEEENFKLESVEVMSFSALIPSLTSGKIDIISAGMYITEKRSEVVLFSKPVLGYGEGLIVHTSDKKKYTAFKDLKGYVVGAQKGTVYVEPLENAKVFKEIKLYDSIAAITTDVANGRIQAGFGDKPIIAYGLLSSKLNNKVRLVKEYKSVITGQVGIAVQKNNKALMKRIDTGLATLKANGKLDKILEKYGM